MCQYNIVQVIQFKHIMTDTDSQIVKALKQWQSHPSNQSHQQSLHEHLCEMLNHMPTDQINGVLHFQRASEYFKKSKFRLTEEKTQQEIKNRSNQKIFYPPWLHSQAQMISKIKNIGQNFGAKVIQNFERQSQILFQPVGISFGPQQNFKLNLTLKMLAASQNAVSLRFWGKILTRNGDYFVIQGVSKKKKQPIISEGMEKYHEGVNYYSYWVCNNVLSSDWYELPLVTPQQIKVSRLIKHVFSGNLNSKIKSYPVFPGEERHLLKCQLVRITHNCEIVPNGLYSKMQQQDQVQFSQQFKMPQFNDLTNLQNWVHLNPYILGVGRADYYKDPKLTEEQREEQLAKLQQTDPKIDRLKGINQDKPIQKLGLQTAWVAKQIGNLQVFNGKQQGTTNVYGSVVLKNPHWPGWLTVANAKSFGSIYIGYGYKQTQDCFNPSSPQDMQVQGIQTDEFDEPNPKNPPDELEPDSDEENKKQEDA